VTRAAILAPTGRTPRGTTISQDRGVRAHPTERPQCAACRTAGRPACSDPGCRGAARTCAPPHGTSMAWPRRDRTPARCRPEARSDRTSTVSAIAAHAPSTVAPKESRRDVVAFACRPRRAGFWNTRFQVLNPGSQQPGVEQSRVVQPDPSHPGMARAADSSPPIALSIAPPRTAPISKA
jgi:hypothetical protein